MSNWIVPIGLVFLAACANTPPKPEPMPTPTESAHASGAHAVDASAPTATGATSSSSASTSAAHGTADPSLLAMSAPAYAGAPSPVEDKEKDEKKEHVPDRFMLRAGGFAMSNIGTSASLSPAGGPAGAVIDFNETLGLDSSSFSGRVDAIYRFGPHSAIGFSWYSFNLQGNRSIDRTIDWNGQTYPINAQINSFLDQDIYKLNYRYSLYHNEEIEFGAEAGLDIQHFQVGLSAPGIGQSSTEAATAPLPVFGAFINYHFTPRLLLGVEYEFFFLELDNAAGSLQDFLLSLEYRVFENVALGAAFNFYSLDAEYTSSTYTFDLQQNWNGLLLYLSVYL